MQIANLPGKSNDIALLSAYEVKKNVRYAEVPKCEKWRMVLVMNVKNILNNEVFLGLNYSEANKILEFVCTS